MKGPLFIVHNIDSDPDDNVFFQIEMARELGPDDIVDRFPSCFIPAWDADKPRREITIGERLVLDVSLVEPLREHLPPHRSIKAWENGGLSVPWELRGLGQGSLCVGKSKTPDYQGLSNDAQKEAAFSEVRDSLEAEYHGEKPALIQNLLTKVSKALQAEVDKINADQARKLQSDIQGDVFLDSWFKDHMTDMESAIWADKSGDATERKQAHIDAIVRGLKADAKREGCSDFVCRALDEATKDLKPMRRRKIRKSRQTRNADTNSITP